MSLKQENLGRMEATLRARKCENGRFVRDTAIEVVSVKVRRRPNRTFRAGRTVPRAPIASPASPGDICGSSCSDKVVETGTNPQCAQNAAFRSKMCWFNFAVDRTKVLVC